MTRQLHFVSLREQPKRHMGKHPDFDVLLNGVKIETAYFNTRGYRVGLPLRDGRMLDPGEVSLTRLRQIVAHINAGAENAGSDVS